MPKGKITMMKYLGEDVYFHYLNLRIVSDENTLN